MSVRRKKETIVDAQTQPHFKINIASAFWLAFLRNVKEAINIFRNLFSFNVFIRPNELLTACLAISVEAMI